MLHIMLLSKLFMNWNSWDFNEEIQTFHLTTQKKINVYEVLYLQNKNMNQIFNVTSKVVEELEWNKDNDLL